ncbi:putative leucine-rich repeat receptor-like serine/threonine-protein kinase At2g24130 [Magnolia sinica]|uniref:putative leucine-rich repeat receptor-like serine/threonine-protein kinase At2g24130 n=1 Tax=Magnolia sinica TaxID=86752 RepID=UPI002659C40B|nr:putative leucine-rich repeat receptor-like serine/threonine-protein kinase At2g24130 [Magnolia sinica]
MGLLTVAITQLLLTFPFVLPLQNRQFDDISVDRSALLAFKKTIVVDPQNTIGNWNSSSHVCKWNGVTCSPNSRRVTELILSGGHLQGTISPFLSNLTHLERLDLSENSLQGCLPDELRTLTRLEGLSLHSNQIQCEIPESFSQLTGLRYIDLSNNQLQGHLPPSLFYNCTELMYIDHSDNSFIGFIPSKIGNHLTHLEALFLYQNQLSGSIPASLSNSSKMVDLDLEFNFLTDSLPSEIVRHMYQLETLHLSYNNLSSDDGNTNLTSFFTAISNLTHLRELQLDGNDLGGELPSVMGQLHVNLSEILLQDNLIYGPIPPSISHLSNLTLLNLSNNRLNGSIPSQIWLLTNLERLCLSNNSLDGAIPSPPGVLTHLGLLDLSRNRLSGAIPSSLGSLNQLRKLILNENLLSGSIPTSLGSCTSLEILDLSHNRLTGNVPAEVAGLRGITIYFNLSSNFLEGRLPLQLGKMYTARAIDLSSNSFSGNIPPNLDGCQEAELINFSHNSLQGPLPKSLGNLISIQSLDLSCNLLSGEIPASLQNCKTLAQLNLSFNDFNGSIPSGNLFDSLTIESVQGNPRLCGSLPGLQSCNSKETSFHSRKSVYLLVGLVSASAFLITICCVVSFRKIKQPSFIRNRGSSRIALSLKLSYPRITYRELVEATEGFEQSRMIGSGSFGRVFKGVLRDGSIIAVKVLQLQAGNSVKTFNRECQILKQIRHRNLMRIVTACSLPDFKALVLPFMANGSLESHLYPQTQNPGYSDLGLIERVNICNDVAEGMAYLHHHSPVQVIHCDLKPSNILLNNDMTALVSDFGISRLIMKIEGNGIDENTTNSTANLVCGSIGYIAPGTNFNRLSNCLSLKV